MHHFRIILTNKMGPKYSNLILSKTKLSGKPNGSQTSSLNVNSFIQILVADIPDQALPPCYLVSSFVMDPENWT